MAPGLRSNENTDDSDERGDNDSRISAAERREIRPNHYVFRENETGDLAFVVMEGTVEIVKQTKNSDVVIATVRKGGMFGEMALIEDKSRMASARAANGKAVEVLVISREVFQKKLDRLDPFTKGLIKILSDHVRTSAERK